MIKFQKVHPDVKSPVKAYDNDAGFDVFAYSDGEYNSQYGYFEYDLGLKFEIPDGYQISIRPRSSISNYALLLCNTPGTIDAGYRGVVKLRFKFLHGAVGSTTQKYKKGDKIAQLIIEPVVQMKMIEVESISDSQRGDKGFGSTGK